VRITFFGTGAFAVPSLEALVDAGHQVLRVVTQPDRPKGRGQHLAHSPVKATALARQLSVIEPARVKDAATVAELSILAPDVQVVVAFGQILPLSVIAVAPLGTVNVHASLLPRYRGAAPIQWAIARGETETGVTTMLIDQGLDTGPLLLSARTPIGAAETAGELEERLSRLGANLLIETLDGLSQRRLVPQPQDEPQASHAPLLKKEDGRIDWRAPAAEIACRVRAFNPWPCAHTSLDSRIIRVLRAHVGDRTDAAPGELLCEARDRLAVACGDGNALMLTELQPESRRPMTAAAFRSGTHITSGRRFV
jgi:methionyl-tRNA formyltransferase